MRSRMGRFDLGYSLKPHAHTNYGQFRPTGTDPKRSRPAEIVDRGNRPRNDDIIGSVIVACSRRGELKQVLDDERTALSGSRGNKAGCPRARPTGCWSLSYRPPLGARFSDRGSLTPTRL